MAKTKKENIELMVEKLQKHPDRFERMFAAQYLAKYNFSRSKKHLQRAVLEDVDPEVVRCIRKILEDR
ncbi:MAG: hypothetical protein ACFFDT_27135 [Candidatus Hodarchaeota archaeon]